MLHRDKGASYASVASSPEVWAVHAWRLQQQNCLLLLRRLTASCLVEADRQATVQEVHQPSYQVKEMVEGSKVGTVRERKGKQVRAQEAGMGTTVVHEEEAAEVLLLLAVVVDAAAAVDVVVALVVHSVAAGA